MKVDDGYTGSNFDRPAFQKMMEAVRAGKINCIVVKDLSRFGRDHLEAGAVSYTHLDVYKRQLHPHRVTRIAAGLLYDGINTFESEPGYLAQAVWTLPQQLHAVRPKMLVDLQCGDWSYLERCQQRHQIPHGLAPVSYTHLDVYKRQASSDRDHRLPWEQSWFQFF